MCSDIYHDNGHIIHIHNVTDNKNTLIYNIGLIGEWHYIPLNYISNI